MKELLRLISKAEKDDIASCALGIIYLAFGYAAMWIVAIMNGNV